MSALFLLFPFLFYSVVGDNQRIINELLNKSTEWSLNIPVLNDQAACYDYWGRKFFRRKDRCMYLFHSRIDLTNGSAQHYVNYDQDVEDIREKSKTEKWKLFNHLLSCVSSNCGPDFKSTSHYEITNVSIEYATMLCCPSPGCFRTPPETIDQAIFYPQNVFGNVRFDNIAQTQDFGVEACLNHRSDDFPRANTYYLGSQKPLLSGVDEAVVVTFGQDDNQCGLGTNGTTSVQIEQCGDKLTENGGEKKCFNVCFTRKANSAVGELWAMDQMLLEMLQTAGKRQISHCVAYSSRNDSRGEGCMIIRDVITGEFLTDMAPRDPATEFFLSEELINEKNYTFQCYLITNDLSRPKVLCDCQIDGTPKDNPPCDAYMYGREEEMFRNMYSGKWEFITANDSKNYIALNASCPSENGELVFICGIVFTMENGFLKNVTKEFTSETIEEIETIQFTQYENFSYYCGELPTGSVVSIYCICPVEYSAAPPRACTKVLQFDKGRELAALRAGRSIANLNHFEDELRRCLREPPKESDEQAVVDYVADFLCYYVHRTSSVGISRQIDRGIYTKNSPPPQLPILRVLCNRKRIISTILVTRGCLCGYYFYERRYRFLVCCCLPLAIDPEYARASQLSFG